MCKSYLRSPWKRRRAPAEELDKLLAPADDPQVDDTLPHAIMALPRPYREVIILHYYQELKAREIADILQEACIGLITAVDRYDPDSSGSFGSYASLWILQNICRKQGTQRPIVYYPVHKKEKYYTMYPVLKEKGYLQIEEIWTNQEARELIQNELGCNAEQAEDIIRQSMPIESLDDIYETFLKDIEKNEKHEGVFHNRGLDSFYWYEDCHEKIEKESLKKIIEKLMKELRPREQEVIRSRYGFDNGIEKTLEEVGHTLGVTRERVRQIESKAMKKLRKFINMKDIRDLL